MPLRDGKSKQDRVNRYFTLEMLMFTVAVISGLVLLWGLAQQTYSFWLLLISGSMVTVSLVVVIRLIMDPDSVRARQADEMLKLASQSLASLNDALNRDSAQKICTLLLPATAATAIVITDREKIIGYAGSEPEDNKIGNLIRTSATFATINDGEMRVLFTPEEIGVNPARTKVRAAIIVPLKLGDKVIAAVKFYYRRPKHITETQKSIAQGFGELLSTQMAASQLEKQTKLATSMELKALQSQINPHFLFNTINTIASLVRTDPDKARVLLREFAVFYRRTLEDSSDLIIFSREIEQTMRYFSFEVARFGEDRVNIDVDVDPAVEDMMVPPFLIQPLVENSVRHAMPSEGRLDIEIIGEIEGKNVLLRVRDNGVGMSEEASKNIMKSKSNKGLGIAVRNVRDRIRGIFGADSRMEVESELGKGTTVTLVLSGAAENMNSKG